MIIHAITEYVAGTSQGASMGDMNAQRMKLNTRQDVVSRYPSGHKLLAQFDSPQTEDDYLTAISWEVINDSLQLD